MDLQKILIDKNSEIEKIFNLIDRLEPSFNINAETSYYKNDKKINS